MFLKKIFYTLDDIKKQITIIPFVFVLIVTATALVSTFFILHNEMNKKIQLLIETDKLYKKDVLNNYIEDIKNNASSVFDDMEVELRQSVNASKGYIKGLQKFQTVSFEDIKGYLESLQTAQKQHFVIFNINTFEVVYGQKVIDYLKTLTNSKLKTDTFTKYILQNIHSLGNENIQYWVDSKKRSIRLSYFEKIDSLGWYLGAFSKIDNIKLETKRAIFESVLTKSKAINGHFWFYDYINNVVYNYYNKAQVLDLDDVVKENKEDQKILNLHYKHPDLLNNKIETIHNFAKFNFLMTIKTDDIKKQTRRIKKEFNHKVMISYLFIGVISFVLILFLRFFTRFLTKIFTRYNRRLQLRSDKFKHWKERYELAITASNDGFWDIDFKDNSIYFSQKWLSMFGYDKEDVVTLEDWFSLIHYEDKEYVQKALHNHIAGKTKSFVAEYRIRNKFNVYKWVLVRGQSFNDKEGRPKRMLMTSMDIDENKQRSKELKDLELLVEVGRIVIFKWKNDDNLSIDYVSKSVSSYGYSKENLEESIASYFELVYSEDIEKLKESIQTAIATRKNSFSLLYRILESNGTIKWVYTRSILLRDHFGNITHLYGYINDVTQMKINEEELKMRVEYEAQKNIEKDRLLIQQSKLASMGEMLGSIAHQWRQPLNNISLLIHFIRDNFKSESFKQEHMNENIADIKFQIEYMSQTIDDFRSFYEPNKDKSLFNIKNAITSAYKIVQTQFEKEDIAIEIKGDDVELFSYENELQQVIVNILNNAKDAIIQRKKKEKFEPKVEISIRKINKKVVMDISNNGGTLSNKVLARIFEPYFTTKFENQGTGIGLYMSKTIIEKNMKGVIGAKKIENGLNFSIILPI